jgi:hypothetical protein
MSIEAREWTSGARGGALLAWGRLLRVSLAPTALADVAAGTVLGAGAWPSGPGASGPFLLMLASACVYHGGMALNDWADRAEDARVRATRPIPGGAIRASAALTVALALLVLGPALGFLAAPASGGALALVAILAALYDLRGRGALLGPLLLGLCRAGNLSAGLLLGLAQPHAEPGLRLLWLAPLLYGLYVFAVSRLARLEDAPEAARSGHGPRIALACGALLLVALGCGRIVLEPEAVPERLALAGAWTGAALALLGARALLVRALRAELGSAGAVMAAVGMALRRLLVATAALAAQAGSPSGLVVAGAILLGYPLAFALRRVFPPT